jgi:hypothetical protein
MLTVASCHASFRWSQDELAGSASSFGNDLSHHLPSRAETKELNLHHCRQPPSPDSPTPTVRCYRKHHLNFDHSSHYSVASLFCLLPNQSTTPSELHPPLSFSFTAVSCPSSLHTTTLMVTNYLTPLSFPKQLIDMWIYVKRYFEILQHRTGLSTSHIYSYSYDPLSHSLDIQGIHISINQFMPHQHPSNIICHIILCNNKNFKWFISLIWYPFRISFSPLWSTRWDEQK